MASSSSPSHPAHTSECYLPFSFPSWSRLPGLRTHIMHHRMLSPVPLEFIQYLRQDGIILPPSVKSKAPEARLQKGTTVVGPIFDGEVEDNDIWADADDQNQQKGDDDDEDQPRECPEFPVVQNFIREALEEYGKAAIPKFTWSSPHDAAWILPGGVCRCQTVEDVFLVLKSSDNVSRDVSAPSEHECPGCQAMPSNDIQHSLVLRKWYDLHQGMEFRCFVRGKQLVGISQRDITKYFPYLKDMKAQISQRLSDFFETVVRPVFPLEDYVFDIYLARKRTGQHRVYLVDFDRFDEPTNALLFDWEDLKAIAAEEKDSSSSEEEETDSETESDSDDDEEEEKEDKEPEVVRIKIQKRKEVEIRVISSAVAAGGPSAAMYHRLPYDLLHHVSELGIGQESESWVDDIVEAQKKVQPKTE